MLVHQIRFSFIHLFFVSLSLIGDWSTAVWCCSLLPQLLACASIQNCHLTADRLQLYSFAEQCHIKAASSPQTHTGGVISNRGRWGNMLVLYSSAHPSVKPLGAFFFSLEKWHSCRVLRMIHVAENTVFRKKWLSRTTVSFSHHFYLSDSHLWDVSCNSGK